MPVMLEEIRKEVQMLTPERQLRLAEEIIHQLRYTVVSVAKKSLDLSNLYGLGRGLWEEDAQEYVNQLREDRV
ncbi:MAG: hypothetical protein ABIF11_00030 [Nitrospirota bacterium]